MKKNTIYFSVNLIFIFLLFITQITYSQEDKEKSILKEKLNNYFNLSRENIYLHFNKETYISDETIWFKGYVIDKSNGSLNLETTNVHICLLDAQKKVLDTKLFLSSFGTISGSWDLDKNLSSGTYYIHAFTNFMNNFEENESSIFELEVLNSKEFSLSEVYDPLENVIIELNPEGGNIIFECDNKIGVKIKDCKGNGIKINNIKVLDSKNNMVNQFSTNNQGYGAFQILNTKNEPYKISIESNNSKIEKTLPNVNIEGINLNCNNSLNNENITIEIKTNSFTLDKIKNKKFKLLVHKNNEFIFSEIEINKSTEKIILSKNDLFEGVNFLRLLDEKNNSISERVIYNHFDNNNTLIFNKVKIENDSLILRGKIKTAGNLSISSLPEKTSSTYESNSIVSALKLNNYLLSPIENYPYYFEDFNRNKNFELDLALLNQKTLKYDWTNILTKQPKNTYEFQKGVNISITLNQILPKNSNSVFTGNLIIPSEKTIITESMNNKDEFVFKNVILRDSTEIVFSLNSNDKKYNRQINSVARVFNNFTRVKIPEINYCRSSSFIKKDYQNLEFPINNKTIQLKNVEVIKRREEMKLNNTAQNKMARGIKINPETENLSLLQFLVKNGYNVTSTPTLVKVYNIGMTKANGSPSEPVILIDDFPLTDLTILRDYNSSDVDEIYFNKFDNSNRTINNETGSIKIYLRRDIAVKKYTTKGLKVNRITNAFEIEKTFLNPYDSNYNSEAFKKHGTIDWIPNILTDNNGYFQIKTPILEQEKILFNIQGIDNEGNLYFENIVINVKE
ncbi:hypothetical protein [Flavobacterium cheniae]|uniref:MG2 domain-containing protein n=1 Tax=Flavobacterium cheniae TaxID=295428 RepID=A0A562KB11_9FLAO|nr:hypothetical protein [Flavobacterium cheniae]TDR24034.1 hypothetical protein C8D80_1062 [Flavobacterium cheniae]TWH92598.1 hypothetical protein IP97_02341 [Flavobacterium cheniae]